MTSFKIIKKIIEIKREKPLLTISQISNNHNINYNSVKETFKIIDYINKNVIHYFEVEKLIIKKDENIKRNKKMKMREKIKKEFGLDYDLQPNQELIEFVVKETRKETVLKLQNILCSCDFDYTPCKSCKTIKEICGNFEE
jgi:DNA-binding transcriptional regulator YhcF (GntR family)